MEMNPGKVTTLGGSQPWQLFTRWSGLSGVIGSIFFVLMFMVAGFLRSGYSPISQAVSDLGVGPMAWMVDVPIVILGLWLIALAYGFYLAMQQSMRLGWRRACATLIALPGVGLAAAGIFTEAPATLILHILIGALLGLYFPVLTFLLVGLNLIRVRDWRGVGVYSLVASVVTVAAIVFMQLAFTPGAVLSTFHIAGLAERVDLIVILAWYVIVGWKLFRCPTEG